MADFDKPVIGDTYVNWSTLIKNVFQSLAKMNFESEGDTNLDDGALQYNRTDKAFEQLASGVWSAVQIGGANLVRSEILPLHALAWSAGTLASTRTTLLHGSNSYNKFRFPKPFKLTDLYLMPRHTDVVTDGLVTGGTATATIYKNGSTTSQSLTINSTDSTHKYASITPVDFAVGDYIEVYQTTSSLTLSNASNLTLNLIGKFTE
jgi:hypothetical protein